MTYLNNNKAKSRVGFFYRNCLIYFEAGNCSAEVCSNAKVDLIDVSDNAIAKIAKDKIHHNTMHGILNKNGRLWPENVKVLHMYLQTRHGQELHNTTRFLGSVM